MNFLPSNVTPLLRPWGHVLAPMIADLLRAAPDLASRLMLLPTRGLHATAIALHAARTLGEAIEVTASRIAQTHPCDLLREALPLAIPEMYRLLDRASVPAWSGDTYRDLERLLRSRVAPIVLEARVLSPEHIENSVELLDADPIVWRARQAFSHSHERRHLSTIIQLLRCLGLLNDLAELPDGAGRTSVFKRIRADLGRGRAPQRRFPDVAGWSRVENVGDLWSIGERLRLCVHPGHWGAARYALGLITGECIFLHSSQHDLLAQVQSTVESLWSVVQIAGARNRDAPPAVRSALEDALISGGLILAPSSADDALNEVLRRESERDQFFDEETDEADIAA